MTLADDLKPLLHSARAIAGDLGLRPYSVQVQVVAYSGNYAGEGTVTEGTTAIVEANGQPPKVRALDDEERAIGGLPDGTWEIGPITPDHAGGGISFATLIGDTATDGEQVHYILTGPEFPSGARFVRQSVTSDRALHYMLRVRPLVDRE